MSLRCLRGKYYYILAPRSVQSWATFCCFLYGSGYYCETALIEKEVNIIIFSASSLCPQSNVQVLTSDNLWKQFRRDKMFSRECLHVQTHISLRCSRKKCYVSFSVPISVLNHLLLVSSAGNLFKQLAPRSGPVNFLAKIARMWSPIWERNVFCFVFKRTFMSFNFHSYFIAQYEFSCRNALRLKNRLVNC